MTMSLEKELKVSVNKRRIVQKHKKTTTGPADLCLFFDQISYYKEQDYHFLELKEARFTIKSSHIDAQNVELDALGMTNLEKNTSLLCGILGKKVSSATLLINPDEEDEVMPAVNDIQRYLQISNPIKFAGITYTKPGGKVKQSVKNGPLIQTLEDATSETPIIRIKGPKSGAKKTKVSVVGGGKILVEGKTYPEVYKAAGFICITIMKMLLGTSDCPNATASAIGITCCCGE